MSFAALRSLISFFEPAARRPEYVQAAALCLRDGPDGPEVLLITSLRTKRWIVPKGWPMKGKSLAEAAACEAWEEAGVRGTIEAEEMGAFTYQKVLKNGVSVPCRCALYRMQVDALAADWPEKKRRERRWVPVGQAALMVAEHDLRGLFAEMASNR